MASSLYEMIGGRSKIQETVTLFYGKVLADPRLRPFFESVNMDGLRARQSMFLTMLLGGARTYGGREIREVHAGARALGLNDSHFDLLMEIDNPNQLLLPGMTGDAKITVDRHSLVTRLFRAGRDLIRSRVWW